MVTHNYNQLISIENLFQAWNEFRRGKRKRKDVQVFERHLEDNLFVLHHELKDKTYKHGSYQSFFVHDPKRRHIHKAKVSDRVVHHLLYKYLYELFDKTFIYDSYSCRLEKGTHKGVKRLEKFTRIVSKNYTRDSWALKLDIKKFFASVDHQILMELLRKMIKNENILWLLKQVIGSFCSCCLLDSCLRRNDKFVKHRGIPLGNLTSQVFANIYMNELDYFIKHKLRIKYYLRYADDFLILSNNNQSLQRLIVPIEEFLKGQLKVDLHPNKIIFRKLEWGIDFLGYIVLPHYILPRTKTRKRILKKLKIISSHFRFNDSNHLSQSLQSYLGYLSHANSYRITQTLKNQIYFMVT